MFAEDLHVHVRAAMGPDAPRVGPFLVGLDPHDAGLFRNYAVPDDGADPSPDEVVALVAAFLDRGRVPRLEYLPELCPALESALVGARFVVERRLPVLVCPPDEAVVPAPPSGVEVRTATTEDDLWLTAGAQHEAYDADPPTEHDLDRLRRTRDGGGLVVLAVTVDAPEPTLGVGGGLIAAPVAGVAELAGIGVRAAYRRRGIAAAMTGWLTRACVGTAITTPFLTPAGPAEERIYRAVGYRSAGEMIHVSLPGN